MAETEPAQQPAEEVQAIESTSSEAFKYDESLLIYVKGKVQAPKQPDHSESRLLIGKLQAEITKRADRIKEIKGIEEQLRGKAQGASSGNADIIKKLQAVRGERAAIIRTKTAIREELRSCDGQRDALRAEMRAIRDKTKFVNVDKLEEELAQLEFRVQHDSLSEAEEKRVQSQIQSLTSARPQARAYAALEARLKDTEAQRAEIVKRLQESDGDLKTLDDAIAGLNATLDESKAKADQHKEDLPALQVEKKENYEICVALRQKIDELRKKNDEEYHDFIKRDRAYKGYMREQKHIKYLERQKEREQREKDRAELTQQENIEAGIEPFHGEVLTCEQLAHYLRGLMGIKEEEAVKAVEVKQVEIPAGLKPFKRDDTLDDIYAGLGKKAKPQKGKAAPAPAPKAPEPAKPKVTKLNFTLETLKTFLLLGIEVPQTSDALPATVEKVEAKKQSFLERRQKIKEGGPAADPERANGHSSTADAEEPSTSGAAELAEAPATPAKPAQQDPTPAESTGKAPPAAAPVVAAAVAAAPAPAVEEAAADEGDDGFEEAPAPPAPPAPAPTAAAPAPAPKGDGIDVKLSVSGDKVSVSIVAA